MILTKLDWTLYAVGAVLLITWLGFFVAGLKHAHLFDGLDEKVYPFKELYGLGYAIMLSLRYQYRSKSDRKLRKELGILSGEKYADYYIRVIYSQKITIAFTMLVMAVPLYGLANDPTAMLVMIMFAFAAYYYFGTVTTKKILQRSEEMLRDFSDVVSKLALLTNAGMIMREAWVEVSTTGESALYVEMQRTVNEMNNGVSEIDAFFNFGTRCVIPEIKKFTSTIVQGMIKGNSELTAMLRDQSKEVWAAKKQNVKRQGEKAASKLLIPLLLMFIGILIMILIPIFTNMGT